MRNYWMRIALGALAIFIVGMLGLSLVRRGIGSVRGVVQGSGPISIPLAFIPFQLNGDKLGSLERVTLEREAPNHVTRVELEVKLSDSVLARGLEGCRLAANLESQSPGRPGVSVHQRVRFRKEASGAPRATPLRPSWWSTGRRSSIPAM